MNKNCQKWREQLQNLRKKHAEFMQTYKDALEFAKQNPKIRETSFTRCRELFYEIKPLVMALREDLSRLTIEQEAELKLLKANFEALPKLHEGIKWEDVEKSLKKSPDAIDKLRAFDEKGHKMNVFREEKGEYIFASGWNNIKEVSENHKEICFDPEFQTETERRGFKPNGNAVSIIAEIMGVKENEARDHLAEPRFHEQLRKVIDVNGFAWLKTDAKTRQAGGSVSGRGSGLRWYNENFVISDSSFRAALRVKKA